jgi:hypothetical protein
VALEAPAKRLEKDIGLIIKLLDTKLFDDSLLIVRERCVAE